MRHAASSQDQARAIMRKYGVATVDMHAPIIEQVATHAARHTSRARLAPHATPSYTRATHALIRARVQCPAHTAHCTRACSLSLRDAPWQCGEPLERQGCFGDPECWGPHCAPAGYAWLARTVIAPAIRGALERRTGGGAPNAPSRTQSRTRRGERVVSESVVAATQLLPSSAAGAQPDSDS